MGDFNWKIPEGTNYTGKNLSEICENAREEFYKKNGYYPTPEEALMLIEEAKEEIKQEKLKRAYDVSYLSSVVKVHTLLFIKLNEIKKYDLCSMIDEYMQHSEIRKKMDDGNWSALNKGYKQLLHSIDFSKCNLKKDNKDYDRILLDWVSHIYVMLQWKYCLSSKEISEKLSSEYLIKLYSPLHEISYPNACEKLYKKFFS